MIHRYLRLMPFDTATEAGRNAERYRLVAWAIVFNVLSKSLALATLVLSVRWTLPYLGVERFGAWMTMAGFVGVLVFLDLGVGNALIGQVARAQAQGEQQALVETVSGGLAILLGLALLAAAVLCLAVAVVPWEFLFRSAGDVLRDEIRQALYLLALMFGVYLFSTGVQKIFVGMQRSFEMHAAAIVSAFLSLLCLWWVVQRTGSIAMLLAATLGCQSTAGLLLLWLVRRRRLFSVAALGSALRTGGPRLFRSGGLFLVLQLGVMVGWGMDTAIISGVLGLEQVAVFAVAQRLFQFVSQPLAMVNAPLWSAYADAHARGDAAFIRRTLRKSLFLTGILAAAGGVFLLVAGGPLVAWWTHSSVAIPVGLMQAFCVWTACEAVGSALAMMLNGCGVVREQVVTVMLLTGLGLPLKIALIHLAGMTAMLWGYTALYVLLVLLMYGHVYKARLHAKMS